MNTIFTASKIRAALFAATNGFEAWRPAIGTSGTAGLNTVYGDSTVNSDIDPATNPWFGAPVDVGGGTFRESPWQEVQVLLNNTGYSNAVYVPTLGAMGSVLWTLSGHNGYNSNGVFRYDIATRLCSAFTYPYGSIQVPFRNGVTKFQDILNTTTGWYSDEGSGEYFADSSKTTTLQDQPAGCQSYDFFLWVPQSAIAGSGAKGSLFSCARVARSPGGNFGGQQAHILDISAAESDPTVGWTRFAGQYAVSLVTGSACYDSLRNKIYAIGNGFGAGDIVHTWDLTAETVSTSTTLAGGAFIPIIDGDTMRYCAARDVIVKIINDGSPGNITVKVIDPTTWVVSTPGVVGDYELAGRGGATWREDILAWVYYDGAQTFTRVDMPENEKTDPWPIYPVEWSGEAFYTHDSLNGTDYPATAHISRFHWIPDIGSYFVSSGNMFPVQFLTPFPTMRLPLDKRKIFGAWPAGRIDPTGGQSPNGLWLWVDFYQNWDFEGLIQPQLDAMKAFGFNCVTLPGPGNVAEGPGAGLSLVNYLARRKEIMDYLDSIDMYSVAWFEGDGGATPSTAYLDAVVADALQMSGYARSVGYNIIGESSSHSGTLGDNVSLASILYNACRAVVPIDYAISASSDPGNVIANATIFDDTSHLQGMAPYCDFFIFNIFGWNPAPSDWAALRAAYPSKEFYLGSCGSPVSEGGATNTARFTALMTSGNAPDCRGLGIWTWKDYDTASPPPDERYGIINDDDSPRTACTTPILAGL